MLSRLDEEICSEVMQKKGIKPSPSAIYAIELFSQLPDAGQDEVLELIRSLQKERKQRCMESKL